MKTLGYIGAFLGGAIAGAALGAHQRKEVRHAPRLATLSTISARNII